MKKNSDSLLEVSCCSGVSERIECSGPRRGSGFTHVTSNGFYIRSGGRRSQTFSSVESPRTSWKWRSILSCDCNISAFLLVTFDAIIFLVAIGILELYNSDSSFSQCSQSSHALGFRVGQSNRFRRSRDLSWIFTKIMLRESKGVVQILHNAATSLQLLPFHCLRWQESKVSKHRTLIERIHLSKYQIYSVRPSFFYSATQPPSATKWNISSL